MLDGLGVGLILLGLAKFVLSGFVDVHALVLGAGLGAATIAAGHVGGGPQPVPSRGYSFPEAMGVLKRAVLGSMLVGGAVTFFGFYFWILETIGVVDVLVLFALSVLIVFASLVAACGLILVDVLVSKEETGTVQDPLEGGAG